MLFEKNNHGTDVPMAEAGWSGLYRAAGVGALLGVGFVLLDMGLSFAGADAGVGEMSAVAWFEYFQSNWFYGLRNLGLFNVINLILAIPLYLALYRLHRAGSPAGAALALILFLFGAAIYTANNRALAMLALSDTYAAAAGEAQQAVLAAAGAVILAQAEDFTPGTFLGFFLSSAASLLMFSVMLRGKVFRKWLGLVGLVGTSCLLLFTIAVTFAPALFDLMMIPAMIGGLLMIAWNIAMALAMFRLGSAGQGQRMRAPAPLPASGR